MEVGNITDKVTQSLGRMQFPAEKREVIKQAQDKGAGDTVVSALEKIPDGVYTNANEVAQKVGSVGK
ncbi:MAG: DUF2795 domain-containing protein [Halofilum sp. (in: g-proteobacteria)]